MLGLKEAALEALTLTHTHAHTTKHTLTHIHIHIHKHTHAYMHTHAVASLVVWLAAQELVAPQPQQVSLNFIRVKGMSRSAELVHHVCVIVRILKMS